MTTERKLTRSRLTPDAEILLNLLALGSLSGKQILGAFLPAIVTQLILAEPDMPEAQRKLCKLFVDEAYRRARNALDELEKHNFIEKVKFAPDEMGEGD